MSPSPMRETILQGPGLSGAAPLTMRAAMIAQPLVLVQVAVGGVQQVADRGPGQEMGCGDAGGDGNGERFPPGRPSELENVAREALRNPFDFPELEVGDQHHEFVAAVAADEVLRPRVAEEERADVAQ